MIQTLTIASYFFLFYFFLSLWFTYFIYSILTKKNKTIYIKYISVLKDKDFILFKDSLFKLYGSLSSILFIFLFKNGVLTYLLGFKFYLFLILISLILLSNWFILILFNNYKFIKNSINMLYDIQFNDLNFNRKNISSIFPLSSQIRSFSTKNKIIYFTSIVGFSTINKLNCFFRIFDILIFGILIYGILMNIFSLDVLNFPSDSCFYFDNPDSEPTPKPTTWPTGPTEPSGTTRPVDRGPIGPLEYIKFTEPTNTGPTEQDIYFANRPSRTEIDGVLINIRNSHPHFANWLSQFQNQEKMGKEVNYSIYLGRGKLAALNAGHLENSPDFNEYVNNYTFYHMRLAEKYGYFSN